MRFIIASALLGCSGKPLPLPEPAPPPQSDLTLRDAASFTGIADEVARSKALFSEIGVVLHHPRCANCHPTDDRPRQGLDGRPHEPPVVRGEDGGGVAGLRCTGCHQEHNLDHARVPGAPHWALAPASMGWIGVSDRAICAQLKDVDRNGGRSLEDLHHHMAEDALVGWAWAPGSGRTPAPGTQAQLGDLVRAWIDTGAHCPEESP